MADTNKVKFGLKNVYYAVATISGSTVTYGTPKAIPGAVSLSLDANGDESNFYADDSKYYVTHQNSGYSGDLEVARVTDDFYKDIFGFCVDSNGNLFEDAAEEPKPFALLFEFMGDAKKTRYAFYNCTASRPTVNSNTTTETKEPVTETIPITANPLPLDSNGMQIVKGKCVEGDASYANWFTSVVTFTAPTV